MTSTLKRLLVLLGLSLGLLGANVTLDPHTWQKVTVLGNYAGDAGPAASYTAGGAFYDTTNKAVQFSNGTLWSGPPLIAPWTAVSNYDAAEAAEGVAFLGPLRVRANRTYYLADIACNWDFAGVGGTTGVVAEVYDLTGAAQVGVCTLGACTTAALTTVTCALNVNFAPAAASTLAVRLTSGTDCTNNPQRITCTVAIQAGP